MDEKSPLISAPLEDQLRQLFSKLNQPVTLICLAGDRDKEQEMAVFIRHIVSLSPLLSCRILTPGEDAAMDALLDGSLLPATGVFAGERFGRMVFHGIPGGRELTAFASAILNAGQAAKALDRPTLRDIGKISRPLDLRVCVSLGCQHCCQLVMHAHRIAWENENVTAHMIDANLYPELVDKFMITRVPLLILNQIQTVPGGKTMAELTSLLSRL